MRVHHRLAGGVAVSAALASAAMLPAAIPAASAAVRPGGQPTRVAAVGAKSITYAPGFAGYKVLAKDKPAATMSVHTTFTVPTLKCPSSGQPQATNPGAALIAKGSLAFENASVLLECRKGKATYTGQVGFASGADMNLPVTIKAGDTVTVGVTVTASSATGCTVTFSDPAQHYSFTQTGPGQSRASFVYIGEFEYAVLSGVVAPPPNFGQLTYTNSSMDGQTLAAVKAVASDRKSSNGAVLIATGTLNTTGNGFAETFK